MLPLRRVTPLLRSRRVLHNALRLSPTQPADARRRLVELRTTRGGDSRPPPNPPPRGGRALRRLPLRPISGDYGDRLALAARNAAFAPCAPLENKAPARVSEPAKLSLGGVQGGGSAGYLAGFCGDCARWR